MEHMPVRAAAKEIIGLMWPPEMGNVARRRIVTTNATRVDKTRFGVLVSVSIDEITMVSSANTKTAVPSTSAIDALHI